MQAKLLICNNPTWLMTEAEGKKLYEQLCLLSGTMEDWGRSDYLGYRGIGVVMDATEKMRVYKGIVEVVSYDETRRFIDSYRDLEMWIFQTSRDKIGDDIYNQLLLSEFQ